MGDRHALGAMIAEEEPVCAFLGDAENAAHTMWTTHTEKLRANYRSTQATITVIKKSVIQLYDLLVEATDEVDEDALQSFFWFDEPQDGRKKRRTKPEPPPRVPEIKKRPPLLALVQICGGFTLASTEEFTTAMLPRDVKIDVAYEVPKGNAFKKYSPHDFKLGKNDIKCRLVEGNAEVISAHYNEMALQVTGVPFKLEVVGFDEKRDVKVRVR